MRVVIDIEADALVDPTIIWCIVAKDIDSGELFVWKEGEVYDGTFEEFIRRCTFVIGHNIIHYDVPIISRLLGIRIVQSSIIDTLVLSRLLNHSREDGHSLEAYGHRFGYPKISFDKFDQYSDEMLAYCINDVHLNHKLYDWLMQKNRLGHDRWKPSIEIEHQIAHICRQMNEDGFKYDWAKHLILYDELSTRVEELKDELQTAFPPKVKLIQLKTKVKEEVIPFNPGSPKMVVERLNEAGWKPTVKTEGHIKAEQSGDEERLAKFKETGWKVNEENLSTLPDTAPEAAHKLVQFLLLAGRKRTLEQWAEFYNPKTGAIHANFNGIGTWTGRMSHSDPNLGNVAAPKSIKYKGKELAKMAIYYGERMRELWTVEEDEWLVGTDADQIQLRIFAHYCNDEQLIEALVNGSKDRGTDLHTKNGEILGVSRDTAKTFIYAFLLGAGNRKLGEIIGGTRKDGAAARASFLRAYPGLKALKEEVIPRDANRGYFEGLDGRLVKCDSEHLMLSGYLQNGEVVIMKHANVLWRNKASEDRISFKQVNFIHDEWQTAVKGDRGIADYLGQLQSASIRDVAGSLGLRCPMQGNYRIGKNWLETH